LTQVPQSLTFSRRTRPPIVIVINIMSSDPAKASCYLTEAARSLRAAIDAQPDADNMSSKSDSSTETLVNDASVANNVHNPTEADANSKTPSAPDSDVSKQKTGEGNSSNSDDTEIVFHPELSNTVSIPDLDYTMKELIDVPNSIIKQHYGDRIRFSAQAAANPYMMTWSIKADDVLEPIAILIRWPHDGSLALVKKEDDGVNNSRVMNNLKKTEVITTAGENIRLEFGCDHIGFYDGVDIVLLSIYDKPKRGALMCVGWLDEIRNKLITWLGQAIRNTNVQMLEPLTGYTLKNSNLEALGLAPPAQVFLHDKHVKSDTFSLVVQFSGCAFKIYTNDKGKVLKVEDRPLPTVDDRELDSPAGVLKSCQHTLIDFLICVGKEHVGDPLKHSYDIVPEAITWYMRIPSKRHAKELIGILQFAPAGTIVPGDWGLRKLDLTFANGEGIVRTAKPLLESMLSFGQKRECYCLALFDYHNVVFVTRCKDTKADASIALISGDRIRGAFVQWLLRSLEIADDDVEAVS
jgi:hypothetical protein